MPKVINNVNHERDKLRGSESLLVGLHHTLAKSGSSSIALYVSWIASSYCSSVYSTLAPTQKKDTRKVREMDLAAIFGKRDHRQATYCSCSRWGSSH